VASRSLSTAAIAAFPADSSVVEGAVSTAIPGTNVPLTAVSRPAESKCDLSSPPKTGTPK